MIDQHDRLCPKITVKSQAELSKTIFLMPLPNFPNDISNKLSWYDHAIEIIDDKTNKMSIKTEELSTTTQPKSESPIALISTNDKASTNE